MGMFNKEKVVLEINFFWSTLTRYILFIEIESDCEIRKTPFNYRN